MVDSRRPFYNSSSEKIHTCQFHSECECKPRGSTFLGGESKRGCDAVIFVAKKSPASKVAPRAQSLTAVYASHISYFSLRQ